MLRKYTSIRLFTGSNAPRPASLASIKNLDCCTDGNATGKVSYIKPSSNCHISMDTFDLDPDDVSTAANTQFTDRTDNYGYQLEAEPRDCVFGDQENEALSNTLVSVGQAEFINSHISYNDYLQTIVN